ncbi:restriction endonuclease [Deinococcus rubellus]|uniref:Restriction endonuclease n=1 Tax=Deinococcus rubellus TaxID=1889240 RepID=A0ABY5YFG5_9DEIO|nr:restriction endonuclease [Deinococcus rubellus]UWX63039.1 restriction endonuclease [Deinococcus rubellus]
MAVPDFQTFMRPMLEAVKNGQEYRIRDLYQPLRLVLQLSEADLQELLPSGKQAKYANRVLWAKFHLVKAGVLLSPTRGAVKITERGQQLLKEVPDRIDMKVLNRFPEYVAFRGSKQAIVNGVNETETEPDHLKQIPPDEQLDALYAELSAALADELLAQVRALTPQQFEILVVQLLVAMGYGGSVRDAGQALGRSGDNGIDGVVKQDPLGLDQVYVQAKQWANNVGSQEVRNFSGCLTYHKASKGVLITTAGFSSSATDTARQIGNIILIGGETLADLMIQYGVGVLTRSTYQVKKIDSDFFEGI